MDHREATDLLRDARWGDSLVLALEGIRGDGGLPLIVGGAVRDVLLGVPGHKDVDVEVHGMTLEGLVASLESRGMETDVVGASFGVVKAKGLGVDFSLPRRDSKVAPGHRGFEVSVDPGMGIKEAARRRDLTINSMAYDALAGKLHDPWGGLADLERRHLEPTDHDLFLDDPLRAMRAAQFVSRLGFVPSGGLVALCSKANLSELPGERLFEEFNKLLRGRWTAMGLLFMFGTRMLRFFPELHDLVGCQQDPEWHPEGDVWTHTVMAVEEARNLYRDAEPDMVVMWATLCHDLGKPSTTRFEQGRVRSRAHEEAGVEPARRLLGRLKAPNALVEAVCAITRRHLAPAMFCGGKNNAGPGAFRRLALELADAGTSIEALERVSRADHFGRTTPDALARQFPAGDEFLRKARNLNVSARPDDDVVLGRHLVDLGMPPSPDFGRILRQCRDIQFETGLRDPQEILRRAGVVKGAQ